MSQYTDESKKQLFDALTEFVKALTKLATIASKQVQKDLDRSR